MIFSLFIIGCYYAGLFSPEAVPEFVLSTQELISLFPALAPPQWVGNATAEATKAAEAVAEAAAKAAAEELLEDYVIPQ